MKVKKGTILIINHKRKGTFKGIARDDFDTEVDEFYPIVAGDFVCGMASDWEEGEEIPCRNSLCNIEEVPNDL